MYMYLRTATRTSTHAHKSCELIASYSRDQRGRAHRASSPAAPVFTQHAVSEPPLLQVAAVPGC